MSGKSEIRLARKSALQGAPRRDGGMNAYGSDKRDGGLVSLKQHC